LTVDRTVLPKANGERSMGRGQSKDGARKEGKGAAGEPLPLPSNLWPLTFALCPLPIVLLTNRAVRPSAARSPCGARGRAARWPPAP
jgi:hypothetical protein